MANLNRLISAHPKIKNGHELVSNLEMSNFSDEQGRTRVYNEAYLSYVEEENPRRTQLIGKRAISGWKLISVHPEIITSRNQ